MVLLMCKGRASLKNASLVKNIVLYIACFITAFCFSRYGMPLYGLTSLIIDTSQQLFGRYQTGFYEMDADPLTFSTLIFTVALYALVIFGLVKMALRQFR
ncbi:hypothetical protein BGV46_07210 [Serratia marcescens]|nr:hypothetical protein BGV45_07215 [Serratia marcescens]OHT37064.1 hypothetical protein BGV46_07210 [Serratia marcescens]